MGRRRRGKIGKVRRRKGKERKGRRTSKRHVEKHRKRTARDPLPDRINLHDRPPSVDPRKRNHPLRPFNRLDILQASKVDTKRGLGEALDKGGRLGSVGGGRGGVLGEGTVVGGGGGRRGSSGGRRGGQQGSWRGGRGEGGRDQAERSEETGGGVASGREGEGVRRRSKSRREGGEGRTALCRETGSMSSYK